MNLQTSQGDSSLDDVLVPWFTSKTHNARRTSQHHHHRHHRPFPPLPIHHRRHNPQHHPHYSSPLLVLVAINDKD